MKLPAWLVLAGIVLVGILTIRASILASYEYENSVASYWSLSEKASTIQQKSEYLDKFIASLQTQRFAGNNAIWLKTPDNSFEQNLHALRSLQGRMHEIIGMDANSFQYQTALQQITQQEMNEARHMLEVFEGTWYLANHPVFWDWYGALTLIAYLGALLIAVILVVLAHEHDSY